MKTLKKSLPIILFFIAIISDVQVMYAQKKSTAAKDSVIKSLVENQRYVFYAQNVTPLSGRQRFLTTDYTVYVSKDTIVSDLPYFGRAYSASINPTDGGIKFTSTNFDYKLSPKKKGGWDISIKTRDVPGSQQFSLSVFENGTASLQAVSNDRQSISFYGYIRRKK